MDQLTVFALTVCADLRAVSAHLWQLERLRDALPVLLNANADVATGTFFAGLHYERGRHGDAAPEPEPEDSDGSEDPELTRLLDEAERDAERLTLRVGRLLDALTADAAADFLSMWEAWGRFSRQRAGVGPMDLMRTVWNAVLPRVRHCLGAAQGRGAGLGACDVLRRPAVRGLGQPL